MKQNWTYKKLGEVCETTSGGTPSKDHNEYYEGGTIPWLRSGEVANRNITRTEMFITQKGVDNSSAKLIPQNSVVIAMYGATVGQVGILRIEATTNQAVCSITPNDSFVPEFLYYTLLSHKKAYLELAVGGAQPNISQQIIKNTTIPLPPLETQSRIVSELDLLQSLIDKQKAQLKELDTLAQSVFYDMFGDPVENEKGWEVKRFDEIGEIVSGSTPSTTDISNWDGNINWITPAEMGVQLYYGETQRKITEKAAKKLTLMPVGTVLLSSRAPIGKLAITSVPMCCNQGFKNIICGKSVVNVFLYYYLKLTLDNVIALGRGATFKEVSKQAISTYTTIVPPISLQQSFASKIESIEKQKATIAQSIAETQKLFNYTMDKYFG